MIDQAHQVRIVRAAATSLVRRQQYLGSQQRSNPNVFNQVKVVANEDSGAETMWRIEDGEFVAGCDVIVLECVKFAVTPHPAIRHSHHVSVVVPVLVGLYKAGPDGYAVPA